MTFREILVGYPGTKSIDAHPYYRGPASRWAWRLYHHRFTRAGRWILAIAGLAAFTFFVFWSLDTQTWVAALFLAVPYLTSAVACLFPPDVDIQINAPTRVAVDKPFPIPLRIRSRRAWPTVDLRVFPYGLPDGLDALDDDGTPVGAVTRTDESKTELWMVATRRGVHRFSGWRVASDFPFGLLDAYRRVRSPLEIVVAPVAASIRMNATGGGISRRQGGPEAVSTTGDALEFSGNRPWRVGDRPRDVDWRATARHLGSPEATLIVREWHKSEETPVVVVLDLAVAPKKRKPWHAMEDPTRLVDPLVEAAVSLAAGIVASCREQQRELRFVELSDGENIEPPVSSGPHIDYRLAAAQGTENTTFDPTKIATQLPRGMSTLVWIATYWDQNRAEGVTSLRRAGLNPRVLVLVPDENTVIDDPAVVSVPVGQINGLRVDI